MTRTTPKERLAALPTWVRCYRTQAGDLRYILRIKEYDFLLKWAARGVEREPCKKRR